MSKYMAVAQARKRTAPTASIKTPSLQAARIAIQYEQTALGQGKGFAPSACPPGQFRAQAPMG